MSQVSPDWYPDPSGRFAQRYHDGERWTEHVADAYGNRDTDPPVASPEPAAYGGPAQADEQRRTEPGSWDRGDQSTDQGDDERYAAGPGQTAGYGAGRSGYQQGAAYGAGPSGYEQGTDYGEAAGGDAGYEQAYGQGYGEPSGGRERSYDAPGDHEPTYADPGYQGSGYQGSSDQGSGYRPGPAGSFGGDAADDEDSAEAEHGRAGAGYPQAATQEYQQVAGGYGDPVARYAEPGYDDAPYEPQGYTPAPAGHQQPTDDQWGRGRQPGHGVQRPGAAPGAAGVAPLTPTVGLVVAAVGGFLLLLSLFALDFLKLSVGDISQSLSLGDLSGNFADGAPAALASYADFGRFLGLAVIVFAVVVVLRGIPALENVPRLPFIVAAVCAAFAVWHLLAMLANAEDVDVSPTVGAVIGLLGYAGLAAGPFLTQPLGARR